MRCMVFIDSSIYYCIYYHIMIVNYFIENASGNFGRDQLSLNGALNL